MMALNTLTDKGIVIGIKKIDNGLLNLVQNSTILALSPRGQKDEHKSEVNLNIDFVTGDF